MTVTNKSSGRTNATVTSNQSSLRRSEDGTMNSSKQQTISSAEGQEHDGDDWRVQRRTPAKCRERAG